MVYITGDTHGELDIHKLSSRYFPNKGLTKDDYVIICGDFGFIWNWEETKEERYWLQWLNDKPWTTLFVDGNHENHPRLASYPVTEWHGGKVHQISDSVYHLMRGQVFDLDGRTFFTMGGAQSHDIMLRTPGLSWWEEEEPSESEYEEALRNLEVVDWTVDYVITHELPTKQLLEFSMFFESYVLTNWLNGIRKRLQYKHWFAGHHHEDRDLSDGVHVLYDRVVSLEDVEQLDADYAVALAAAAMSREDPPERPKLPSRSMFENMPLAFGVDIVEKDDYDVSDYDADMDAIAKLTESE